MSLRVRLLLPVALALGSALSLMAYAGVGEPRWLAAAALVALVVAGLGAEVLVVRRVRTAVRVVRQVAGSELSASGSVARQGSGLAALVALAEELGPALESRRVAAEQTEVRRRVAETLVAGVLDIQTDGVIGVDAARHVTFFNKGAERIFGAPARRALGQPLDLFLPGDVLDAHRPTARDLAPSAGRLEVIGRRQDGGRFPAEVSVSRRTDGDRTAFLLMVRDVTETRRGEEALRESEARFRGAFEHSGAGMVLARPDGSLLRVNRALGEMLGYPEQELLTTTLEALALPDQTAPDEWHERSLLAGSVRWYQREQRYRHRQGHVVWGLLSVSLIRAADGSPTHRLVQIQDITERKRAEELEAQLRQAQKIEAVGQLAAGVAHDFNNLLMVVTGRSHILLHRLPAGDPLRRHVELIQTTSLRAGALTQQLLAFSRRQALQPKVLDLGVVVAGMVAMLRRLIGEPIELTTEVSEARGRVKADAGQIEQVILNLVVNARDAMPKGGRLTLSVADVELDEAFVATHPGASPGSHVELAVRDTGAGMDVETRARLFEPFFTTKAPGKGTGLGLATVYGIVKQGGGYVDVESEVGAGTIFRVFLPRVPQVDEAPEAAAPVPHPEELPRGWETILLVEDEEIVRDLAREILEQAGYTVLGAHHGGEALLLGDRHQGPIHMLVTDVVMPELGGRELAERLAASRPAIRVVYMSGYPDEAIEPHGVLTTGASFLRKPLTPEDLRRKVREILDAPGADPGAPTPNREF